VEKRYFIKNMYVYWIFYDILLQGRAHQVGYTPKDGAYSRIYLNLKIKYALKDIHYS